MKKFFKIAVIVFGIMFLLFFIIGLFSADSVSESNKTNTESATIEVDSVQIKKDIKIKDSLELVKKLKKESAEKQLKRFKKKVDEFNGTTFYTDTRAPKYTNVNFIYPYIGEKDNRYWLRLRFQYKADDWLFIKKGILLVDGDKYELTGSWERDNGSGDIWEWLDIQVNPTQLQILNKIANSESAKIRYEGTQYHNDRTITAKEKNIIKTTLEIFDNLN